MITLPSTLTTVDQQQGYRSTIGVAGFFAVGVLPTASGGLFGHVDGVVNRKIIEKSVPDAVAGDKNRQCQILNWLAVVVPALRTGGWVLVL